jgi:hypothetical protein
VLRHKYDFAFIPSKFNEYAMQSVGLQALKGKKDSLSRSVEQYPFVEVNSSEEGKSTVPCHSD